MKQKGEKVTHTGQIYQGISSEWHWARQEVFLLLVFYLQFSYLQFFYLQWLYLKSFYLQSHHQKTLSRSNLAQL